MKTAQPSIFLSHRIKKYMCLCLVLTMSLGLLSACGNNPDDPKNTQASGTPEYVYVPTYTELSGDFSHIGSSCYSDGRIFFTGGIQTGETITQSFETGMYDESGQPIMGEYSYNDVRAGIFSVAFDGSDFRELSEYKIEDTPRDPSDPFAGYSYTSINRLLADKQGNLWVLENVYTTTFNLPEDFESSNELDAWQYAEQTDEYFLVKLDTDGTELTRLNLAKAVENEEDYFYVNRLALDTSGNIYAGNGNKIYVLDPEGRGQFEIAITDSWAESMFALSDGGIAVSIYDDTEGRNVIKTLDTASKTLSEEAFPCPLGAYNFLPGTGQYDYCYGTDSGLFGVELETGETEKIISWINSGIDRGNISNVFPIDDGRVIALSCEYSSDKFDLELIAMNKTPYGEVEQKKTITYACMSLDYTPRSEIIKFNRTNPEYRIEVQDYSEYNTQDDYEAGEKKLITEILTGKVPDIFSTEGLPIDRYGAKGLLEDLWPFIESDTELGGREGVVQPIFDAISTEDGKLYQIVPTAEIYAVVGPSSIVGNSPGWTVEDAKAALAKMPAGCEMFGNGTTRADVLGQICSMCLDGFVDWQSGDCSFDSDEFIELLEFAALFPKAEDTGTSQGGGGSSSVSATDIALPEPADDNEFLRIMEGRQLLSTIYMYRLTRYLLYKQAFGGDISCVGLPGSTSGTAFSIYGGLAMSSSCKNKEGAWEFISILLDEKYQAGTYGYSSIPTNKKVFDSMVESLMTKEYYTDDETGEQHEAQKDSRWIDDDNRLEVFALTQAEVDEIMAVINNTTRIYTYDEDLRDIIFDECAAFFAGQGSAADTARNVQSRVSLYVNEQR